MDYCIINGGHLTGPDILFLSCNTILGIFSSCGLWAELFKSRHNSAELMKSRHNSGASADLLKSRHSSGNLYIYLIDISKIISQSTIIFVIIGSQVLRIAKHEILLLYNKCISNCLPKYVPSD